jgi:Holliday junction resolvase RusA-like endonuclease
MTPALEHVRFTVPGPPRPKERPRVTSRGTFTPTRTKQYERAVGHAAILHASRSWALDGVYRVTCLFVFRTHRHPDADNCLKACLDGMEGALYRNDKQVTETSARLVVEPGGLERTEVVVERIGDAPVRRRVRRP